METAPQAGARRRCWLLRLQGAALALGLLALLGLLHYWPGLRGWGTYLGYRPRVFTPPREGYRLATPRGDLPGLANFARVSRNLYRAAAADRAGYLAARALGVRTIVDLRELHTDRPNLAGTGLLYVRVPMNAAEIDDEEVADFLRVVRNPDYQPVLVHCTAGSDRTGVVVAIYRVLEQGWPVEQAAAELPRFGFHDVWVPTLEYLREADWARISALAASRPLPVATPVP